MQGSFIRSFLVTGSFLGGFQLIKEPKNEPFNHYSSFGCSGSENSIDELMKHDPSFRESIWY